MEEFANCEEPENDQVLSLFWYNTWYETKIAVDSKICMKRHWDRVDYWEWWADRDEWKYRADRQRQAFLYAHLKENYEELPKWIRKSKSPYIVNNLDVQYYM